MKPVIIVSHICPVPADQGNHLAILQLIAWLRGRGHPVLYVLQHEQLAPWKLAELKKRVDEIFLAEVAPPTLGKRAVRSLLNRLERTSRHGMFDSTALPRRILETMGLGDDSRKCRQSTVEEVRRLVVERSASAVIAEYIYMTPCLDGLPKGVCRLVHTHDMLSRVGDEIATKGISTQGRECTPQQEREALLQADVVMAIQAHEAELFRELVPERQVIVVGYAADTIFQEPGDGVIPGRVLMVGSSHPYNEHGLGQFCRNAWPRVLARTPEAELRVVGEVGKAIPPSTPRVAAVGRVPNLDLEYRDAAVVINPVCHGTGLKIKTIETLGFAKALVSTSIGIEGMAFPDGPACLVHDDWDDFARSVSLLLADDSERRRYEQSAWRYASNQLTTEVVYRDLEHVLRTWSSTECERAFWRCCVARPVA